MAGPTATNVPDAVTLWRAWWRAFEERRTGALADEERAGKRLVLVMADSIGDDDPRGEFEVRDHRTGTVLIPYRICTDDEFLDAWNAADPGGTWASVETVTDALFGPRDDEPLLYLDGVPPDLCDELNEHISEYTAGESGTATADADAAARGDVFLGI